MYLCVPMTDMKLSDTPTLSSVFLVKPLHAAGLKECVFAGHAASTSDAFRFNNKPAQHASAAEQRGLQTTTVANSPTSQFVQTLPG